MQAVSLCLWYEVRQEVRQWHCHTVQSHSYWLVQRGQPKPSGYTGIKQLHRLSCIFLSTGGYICIRERHCISCDGLASFFMENQHQLFTFLVIHCRGMRHTCSICTAACFNDMVCTAYLFLYCLKSQPCTPDMFVLGCARDSLTWASELSISTAAAASASCHCCMCWQPDRAYCILVLQTIGRCNRAWVVCLV
jgi:hypothetical protein